MSSYLYAKLRSKRQKRASSHEFRASHNGIYHKKCIWNLSASHAWHAVGQPHLMRVFTFTWYAYRTAPGMHVPHVHHLIRGRE